MPHTAPSGGTRPPTTLTQYLIEERRRFPQASGALNALILDVALACKAIAREVALGRLNVSDAGAATGGPAAAATINVQGEEQKPLDVFANEVFLRRTQALADVMGEAQGVSKAVSAVASPVPAAGIVGAASMALVSSAPPVPKPAALVVTPAVPVAVTPADPLTAAVEAATTDAPGVTVTQPGAVVPLSPAGGTGAARH